MKKLINILVLALATTPTITNAQWGAVRFDQVNTFTNVYAATATTAFVLGNESSAGHGFLMRTNDSGSTWDSIVLNTVSDSYQFTELFFTDVDNGFVGGMKNNANQSMMKLSDNGTNWIDITPEPLSTNAITALYFVNTAEGYAASDTTLYKTTNGGNTWMALALDFSPLDLNFIDANTGYAAGMFDNTATVMKTINGGLTWNPLLSTVDPNVFVNSCELIDVVNENVLFSSHQWTNKVYRTINGGTTWDVIVCDSVFQIIDFHFDDANSGHVLSAYGQLYQTTDGGATWALEYATEWGFYGPSIYLNSLSYTDGVGYMCGSSGLIKRSDVAHNTITKNKIVNALLNVFPNPCDDMQNLVIDTKGLSGDCSLMVISSTGQLIYSETVNGIRNSAISINALKLAAGTYNIVLRDANRKQTAQVVIVY